jgi:hypothetical protein
LQKDPQLTRDLGLSVVPAQNISSKTTLN